MVLSMTGFGRASGNVLGREITIEIRSVNNRFRDILTYIPKTYYLLEDWIVEKVSERVKRGRLEVRIRFEDARSTGQTIRVDMDVARASKDALASMKQELGLGGEVDLATLVGLGNVIVWEEDSPEAEDLTAGLSPILAEALDKLVDMRKNEGRALAKDLLDRLSLMESQMNLIESNRDQIISDSKSRLEEKIQLLCDREDLDQARLHQEVAYLVEKGDITEELTRLRSHFEQFRSYLDQGGEIGRRLDFLIQEILREVNTISSKIRDVDVTKTVIEIKGEVEKLREQVQNIE